ncbi:ATP synthase subunit b [Frankliniella fusca]|uniref:ATP synthase subunit b n=1 Tax=Frankliniella fusca TaxID=407009 RepID=A0AAE1LUW3_9NEOP|nr:ATP synthase subunit b [Frankliniella fusca]
MFISTLNISVTWVKTALKKFKSNNGAIPNDGRGKKAKNNHVSSVLKEDIMAHIKQFPVVEGHYTRKNSKSRYISENLNKRKMWSLYKIQQEAAGVTRVATLRQYRDVFNKDFRLKFFRPKKDQCPRCLSWKNKTPQEKTDAARLKYESHIAAKQIRQEMKQKDIDDIKNSPDLKQTRCVITCDLEKILTCPKGENGDFYYKSKMSVCNFTIFVSGDQEAFCYVWDQTIGSKGAAEIGSCLWLFIQQKVQEGIKEFVIYSDNCSAQNKSQFLFSLYVMASIKFQIKITHRYLEVGHTHMECDSIHATLPSPPPPSPT